MTLTLACMISCQNLVVQNKLLSFFVLFLWLVLAASGDIACTVSYISVSPLYHSCTHVFDRASSNCIIRSQRSTDLESFFTRRLTTHHCFSLLLASADAIFWVMHDTVGYRVEVGRMKLFTRMILVHLVVHENENFGSHLNHIFT